MFEPFCEGCSQLSEILKPHKLSFKNQFAFIQGLQQMNRIFRYLFLVLLSFPTYAVEGVDVVKVKENIHVLISPAGGNVVVSTGEDGTFLIDDQLPGRSELILSAVKEIDQQEIKFVLNTHYHFDHVSGNELFGEQGAVIVAHDNVRQRLSTRQFISYFQKEFLPHNKAGLPSVTISDQMTLHYNNDEIHLFHTPAAHTDGDVVAIFTQANVIVGGDLVFNGRYPFLDVEHGGSIKGLINGLDSLLAIADDKTTVIPGHGGIMNKSELQYFRDMLNTISNNVEAAINEGKTLAQVIADKPSINFDEEFGQSLIPADDLVTAIYKSLKPE
jgi:cyclase